MYEEKTLTVVKVTAEDVQRVLDLGRILRSVLTEEELLELEITIKQITDDIGNTGDS